MCLYYKTGSGKTPTAVSCIRVMGQREALVVAPPTTHDHWKEWGHRIGVSIETMSHAKFRRPETKLSRTKAIVVDEFHMLGGY
jgi:superfamily II DNA or RNA helicase